MLLLRILHWKNTPLIKIPYFPRASILKIYSGFTSLFLCILWGSILCSKRSDVRIWTSERRYGRCLLSCWSIALRVISNRWLLRLSEIRCVKWSSWGRRSREGRRWFKIMRRSIRRRMLRSSRSWSYWGRRILIWRMIRTCFWRIIRKLSRHLMRKFPWDSGLRIRLMKFMECIESWLSNIRNYTMIWPLERIKTTHIVRSKLCWLIKSQSSEPKMNSLSNKTRVVLNRWQWIA